MIHVKLSRSQMAGEAWVEVGFDVVCTARLLRAGGEIMVDLIETAPAFRRMGHASSLVRALRERTGLRVVPVGVLDTPEARAFWRSLGLA